jgi:hypothetical protein
VTSIDGFNLLQRAVGIRSIELVKWIVVYGCDVNRGPCSLPLHIACQFGTADIAELLYKNGARADLEARMCFPGPHTQNCELGRKAGVVTTTTSFLNDRLQSAEYYCIDGDKAVILGSLMRTRYDISWFPFRTSRKNLLYPAFERGAWDCVNFLILEQSEDVNKCLDEYYPVSESLQPVASWSHGLFVRGHLLGSSSGPAGHQILGAIDSDQRRLISSDFDATVEHPACPSAAGKEVGQGHAGHAEAPAGPWMQGTYQ